MKSFFKTCFMVFAFFLISTQMTFAADVDGMQGVSPPKGTTATGTDTYQNWGAERAIDKSTSTRWLSSKSSASLELNFPEPTFLKFVQIAAHSTPRANTTYTVYGLQNGNWAAISTPNTFEVFDRLTILDPIEVTAGKYDAIRINAVSSQSWINIYEVTIGTDQTPGEPGTEEPTNPDKPSKPEEPGTEQPGTEQPGTEKPGTEEPTTPEQPSGNRAILVVTMTTGLEKEFDLSMKEVNAFIAWYEAKQSGSGKASYAIDKHNNNKGPFSSRKDYILYDRVLTFEVNEY
ncbi:fibronectin type III domain-containing protein [Paenibacillus sp. CAA11]|uniref:fibronectin type III domain-containing protein n=1 Tax=Paenibacillus sp. CAA11 TaxID=1532905 RepID=UPI000D35D1A4|nr:fibronectin type III domain-containing protein [Paenibacillus sp. CAA11]AWB44019.1 fibronectin type III domain-containing protein [Paenibacillus sp. CAA11]